LLDCGQRASEGMVGLGGTVSNQGKSLWEEDLGKRRSTQSALVIKRLRIKRI